MNGGGSGARRAVVVVGGAVALVAVVVLGLAVLRASRGAGDQRSVAFDPVGASSAESSVADDESSASTSIASADDVATVAEDARFETLPPGSLLPGDEECAGRVRPAPEVRPENAAFNATPGRPTAADADPNYPRYGQVTGAFTGTTDEIIQWVACKWGIDEDVVRAQAAKETYWFQRNLGDFNADAERCVPGHPIGADGEPGRCPESIGIMQVRYPYFRTTITDAITSTAYNLDLAYAVWRTCFEGEERWLNDVERGREYAAGDLWGCVGRWFAGRWYTDRAQEYLTAVQDYVGQRIWETPGFLDYTP